MRAGKKKERKKEVCFLFLAEVKQLNDVAVCVTVIFLISSNEDEEPLAEFTLYFSACKDSSTHVVFVPMHNLSESEWNKLSSDYKAFCKEIPKLCTIAKWPGEGGRLMKLRWKNFWSKLQSSLPKPLGVCEQIEAGASCPLLEDRGTPTYEHVGPNAA